MPNDRLKKALKDDESLAIFLRGMAKLDHRFCDSLAGGEDFTLKFELRGDNGRLLHCRVLTDEFERPQKNGKNEEKL